MMQTVNHKIYGVGEVINKETTGSDIYITVKFESGKEVRFLIPDSFTFGIMVANGDLKDEVDAAIAEKKAREAARREEIKAEYAAATPPTPSNRYGRTPATPVTAKGSIEIAFEEYLIDADYETETPSGHPSTVYSYSGAIDRHVLENERITWDMLRSDIDNIVKKYDVGGKFEHIGAKSNNTVINALKRFREFVNS